MADAVPSPQILSEFVQNLLDDLKNDRITPDAAIVASQQYPYLRALVSEHTDEIALALQDEEKLRVILEGVLAAAAAVVRKELPQFQVEKPDQQLSPNDVVVRARAFRSARSQVVAAAGQQRMGVGQLRKTFINRLVQNWVAQTRTIIDKDKQQELADALKTELEQGLLDDLLPGEVATRIQRALKNTRVAEGVATAIQREAAPVQQEFAAATQKLAGITKIPKELMAHITTPRPDRFVIIAIQTISSTTLSPSAALARAASLTRTAEALSVPLPQEKDVTAAGVFFRAFASGSTQKAFAAVADALLGQLSPLARQEVIKATFSRALERAMVRTNLLTERLGREFVESELFQLVVDSARKEFARGAGGGAGGRQARGALEDIIGSVLRGPIAEPLVGSPREAILSYFELLAVESRLPHDKKVLFPDHAPVVRALSLLSGGLSADAHAGVVKSAGFASSAALQAAASQLTQRLPSWRVFNVMMLSSSFFGLGQSALISLGRTGQDVVQAPGAAGIGFLSFFGNVGLQAVSGVGRVGLSLIEGLGGGLIGMMFGGGLGGVFNRLRGPRAPDRFFDDMPKFMAVFIVVTIVVLFVFPSFLNSAFTSRAAKYAALLVNSQPENQPDAFVDDGQVYPPPDYINFANLGQLECLNTATGGVRGSVPFGEKEQTALEETLAKHKELSLLSCPLRARCESGGINLSRYTQQRRDHPNWLGFAPSANPGNIILYPGAFTSTSNLLAKILAHELMHQVQYFRKDVFSEYVDGVDCGFVDIYRAGEETTEERFAEAGALYLMGNPAITSLCGGKTFEFYQSMFSQCQ